MTNIPSFLYVLIDDDPTVQYMSIQALMFLFVDMAKTQHIDVYQTTFVSELIQGFHTKDIEINVGKRKLRISTEEQRAYKMLTVLH